MMNQPLDESGKGIYYRNSLDCFGQAVKNEGEFILSIANIFDFMVYYNYN